MRFNLAHPQLRITENGAAQFTAMAVLVLIWGRAVVATEAKPADRLRPLLAKFCSECHGQELQEGQVNFDKLLSHEPLVRDREIWRRAIQLLEMKVMPPESASTPPTDSERRSLLDELDRAITKFDYSTIDDPGSLPLRRLTHREYNNTIRDLFGVDLQPAARFPTELTGTSGFDNSANTLSLQPALMERYIAASELVVEIALPAEPMTAEQRKSRELIFVSSPNQHTSEDEAARAVLSRFLLRAFRRPPAADEVQAVVSRFQSNRAAGKSFHDAITQVLPSVLISPKFLLRVEEGNATNEAQRISDWDLASRLSYFMWASMPDDELFDLAARGELHEPDVLTAQVKRMLADQRAETLGEVFAGQWLNTQLIGTRIRLDPIDNPWCTDSLMSAMRAETSMFFMSLLRENRKIDELIDSDYTFVNEELARTLYKMEGIDGEHMRRISIEDSNRGGILGQPGVLTVTASHMSTSPVKRGVFILDSVLGTPPPPPPPDAGTLNEELRENERLTFREKLEKHAGATCQACHATMDPVGIALENFDYFGRWRDKYRKKPINTSAAMPDGTTFSGPADVKNWILEKRHDELVRQVASKMLAYALGRQLEYYDEPALQRIVTQLEADEFRFQTLLQSIVTSYPFQYRKNSAEAN
jgi:hypothetical protein